MLKAAADKHASLEAFSGDAGYPRNRRRTCRDGIEAQAAHFAKDQGCLCRPAHTLDSGTDVCLAGQLPALGQGF